MADVKVLNVEIADSEVYRLMQENYLGCYLKQFPTIDQDIKFATGQLVITAVVEVYPLTKDGKRDDGRVIQDIGSYYVEPDENGKFSGRDLAIAKEIALTKARRRAVLCYLGKEYDYEEVSPAPKKKVK
jgi:hypothetical protein